MINFDDVFSKLPEMPNFVGQWAPVYLEPMMASGEKLTIAVAALGCDGTSLVRMALHSDKVHALYGEKAESFINIIQTIVTSLQFHLHTKQTFEEWSPPFGGVTLGNVRDGMSSGLLGLLRQAVSMTASLSALDLGEDSSLVKEEKNDRWPNLVRDEVLLAHSELSPYFKQTFSTSSRSKACKIFFLSPNIAINTGRLVPGAGISYNFDVNKSRILDLLTVKENEGYIAPRVAHELVVYRPTKDDPSFNKSQMKSLDEYVYALVDAGDKHDIRVTTVNSPEQAAKRLCKLEIR